MTPARCQAALPGLEGGWVRRQWNFLPSSPGTSGVPISPGGINAVGAWRNLIAAGRPGAKGVTVAVLDTGIAYRNLDIRTRGGLTQFQRSPDFSAGQFVPGYNFVDNNQFPVDTNGHGTHVASTIAEETNNGLGLTGLAYKAKLMPVQVLNSDGEGQASNIAKGIRFAAEHGAQVINMSFNFGCHKRVPGVDEALQFAAKQGAVLVASVGNVGSETLRVCTRHRARGDRGRGHHPGGLSGGLLAGRRRCRRCRPRRRSADSRLPFGSLSSDLPGHLE